MFILLRATGKPRAASNTRVGSEMAESEDDGLQNDPVSTKLDV